MINDVPVSYASIEDLIIYKIFAGRERDVEDVRIILINNREIEIDFIKKYYLIFLKFLAI